MTFDELEKCTEPTHDEVYEFMRLNPNESFYTAREKLRENAYGGKAPGGGSWGDYWKSY